MTCKLRFHITGERELRTPKADELAPRALELLNFTLVVTLV